VSDHELEFGSITEPRNVRSDRAAATELDGAQDIYAVESPPKTIHHREYTVHDQP